MARRLVIADKAIVCACEDVTVADRDEAVARGFGDIESMKRYTGLGTGPCQGKSCLASAVRYCADRADLPPEARVPFRARPPLTPTTISAFAGLPESIVRHRESPLQPPPARPGPHPLRPREPLPAHASVVIIGGGIMGLRMALDLHYPGDRKVF